MARESWSPSAFHLGECHGRIQMWRCALPCQHATTEAFRISWHSWKFWGNTGFFFKHLNETNTTSLLVGGIALALVILGKIFLKHKPVALFAVIGGIVAASALSLEAHGVQLIGAVPQGIPPLKVPVLYWRDLNEL